MMFAALAIFSLLVLTFIAIKVLSFRKKKKNAQHTGLKPLSNVRVFLRDLKGVRAVISANSCQIFCELLSASLKKYISSVYEFSTDGMTSDEIIDRLMSDPQNDWTEIGFLAEIFKITDSVRFSGRQLSVNQQRGLYKKSCRIVRHIEKNKQTKV